MFLTRHWTIGAVFVATTGAVKIYFLRSGVTDLLNTESYL